MIYVPGALFSVNPITAQHVPGFFAINERVVCEFESAQGPFVMVLVGATIVGGMATVWHMAEVMSQLPLPVDASPSHSHEIPRGHRYSPAQGPKCSSTNCDVP